jgi:hypothetical protein
MITNRLVRWYVALVGILLCATLYFVLPVNAGCVGHECVRSGEYMGVSHPLSEKLVVRRSAAYLPARLPLTIKPLK